MAYNNGIPLSFNANDARTAIERANMNLIESSKHPLPNGATETKTLRQLAIKKVEKLKVAKFPMKMLRIGYFKVEAKYPLDLMARCYYGRRKLALEILHDGLMTKIEIQWQNISAIGAVVGENSQEILVIELNEKKKPSFLREINPTPKTHTSWTECKDFTGGDASTFRRHYLEFAPGILKEHYKKLLQCDNRLLELSRRPFPSSLFFACFDSNLDQRITHSSFSDDLHVNGPKTTSTSEQQPTLISPEHVQQQTSGILSHTNEAINNQMLQNPMLMSWNQGSYCDTSLSRVSVPSSSYIKQNGLGANNELPSHINDMLMRGYYIPEIDFDERNKGHVMKSIDAIADLSIEAIPTTYNTTTKTQDDQPHTSVSSWNAFIHDLEQQHYASDVNMQGDPPNDDLQCWFSPDELLC